MKSYNQGFTEEATLRLVGRMGMQKGLALLSQVVAEILVGHLRCKGFP